MIANLLFSPRAKRGEVPAGHETRITDFMAVRFAVDAKGSPVPKPPPSHSSPAHDCSPLFAIVRPARNIAPVPVSSHRPPFTVGLAVNANEPMLRKGNVLDCVDGGRFRVAGTNRPGYNNPAPPRGSVRACRGADHRSVRHGHLRHHCSAPSTAVSVRMGFAEIQALGEHVGVVLSALNRLTVPPHSDFGI